MLAIALVGFQGTGLVTCSDMASGIAIVFLAPPGPGIAVGLGPRILRTETAPLYALSAVSYAVEMNQTH